MDLTKREPSNESGGIGLGWLLALSLGGGILFFAAVGLLFAWRVRARGEPCTTRVYANDVPDETPGTGRRYGGDSNTNSGFFGMGSLTASSTTRLVRKKFAESGTSFSRLSSKTYLPGQVPPMLPPLPTYHSFRGVSLFGRSDLNPQQQGEGSGPVPPRPRCCWFSEEEDGQG